MQGVGVARIRVPGGHVRREVAISETTISTLAEELLSAKPGYPATFAERLLFQRPRFFVLRLLARHLMPVAPWSSK